MILETLFVRVPSLIGIRYLFLGLVTVLVVGLAGCGGGDSNSASNGGQPAPAAVIFTLSSDLTTIKTGSSNNAATITVSVRDTNNVPLEDVVVEISADSGEFMSSPTVTTDRRGMASAALWAGNDKSNRTINVSAIAYPGDDKAVSATPITVETTGTTVTLIAPNETVEMFDTEELIATVTDADGFPVTDVPVTLTSALAAQIFPATSNSLDDGTAGFGYTAMVAGTDTLTASIAGASSSLPLTITELDPALIVYSITASRSEILSGARDNTALFTVTSRKANGAIVPAQAVNVSVDNGGVSSITQGVTDASGNLQFEVGYGADRSDRRLTVTVQGGTTTADIPINVAGTTLTLTRGDSLEAGGPGVPWTVALLDADGVPIQDSVQMDIRSGTAMLNYQLDTILEPLPPLMLGGGEDNVFELGPTTRLTGYGFTIKAIYGLGQQQSNAVTTRVVAPYQTDDKATVTADHGTNFDNVIGYDSSIGWIVPVQENAVGPSTLATQPGGTYDAIQVTASDLTGQPATIALRGSRANGCSTRPMHGTVACQGSKNTKLRIWYDPADNPSLPDGIYTAEFRVAGYRQTDTVTPIQQLTIRVNIAVARAVVN